MRNVKFQEDRAAHESVEMERGRREEVGDPGMGNTETVVKFGHVDNFARHRQASAARNVWLHNVNLSAFDQRLEAPFRRFLLAAGNQDVNGICQLRIAVVIFRVQHFFQEERTEGFKAVGNIKRAVCSGLEVPFESGLAIERELQQLLFQSADAKEGLHAYVEKRMPEFRGE